MLHRNSTVLCTHSKKETKHPIKAMEICYGISSFYEIKHENNLKMIKLILVIF